MKKFLIFLSFPFILYDCSLQQKEMITPNNSASYMGNVSTKADIKDNYQVTEQDLDAFVHYLSVHDSYKDAALKSPVIEVRADNPGIVARFRKYADGALRAGIVGEARHKHPSRPSRKGRLSLISSSDIIRLKQRWCVLGNNDAFSSVPSSLSGHFLHKECNRSL